MQRYGTLSDAKALARFAHFHQKDKSGEPYIDHPLRVLATVQAQGVKPYVQIAAVLHDVPEDTAFSHDVLLQLGFSEAVVELTRLLDRGYSQEYHRKLIIKCFGREKWPEGWSDDMRLAWHHPVDDFYYQAIKANRDATIIKLADIADNTSGWRLSYLPEETQKRLQAKYHKALNILNPPPVNHGMLTDYRHDPFTLR
jgi:(p)ppGpp synthase/HD superfamily hydrolase